MLEKMTIISHRSTCKEKTEPLSTWKKSHFDMWWLEPHPYQKKKQLKIDIELAILLETALRRFG